MRTRIFKYALRPTEVQRAALEEAGVKSRVLWNGLVRRMKRAQEDCAWGRRGTVLKHYASLQAQKKCVGLRVTKVKELMREQGCLWAQAVERYTALAVEKAVGGKSNRALCADYASLQMGRVSQHILRKESRLLWYGLLAKWKDSTDQWLQGKRGAPVIKRKGQRAAVQWQVQQNWEFGACVDLSKLGTGCLKNVAVVVHRDLPKGIIKQVAVVKNSVDQWFVCVFLEADDSVFARAFPAGQEAVGIDPGMKCAMTLSDGTRIEPSRKGQKRKERKLIRLQRRLDRQSRANNPHLYRSDGTFIKGRRIQVRTQGMRRSVQGVAGIKAQFQNARTEYYHQQAIRLLSSYDKVFVGSTKVYKLARGRGRSKRAQNKKVREHAISDFVSKLKDKASLSVLPKHVDDKVNEQYTTRSCSVCSAVLIQPLPLSVRQWTCACGATHDRDVNAAKNICSVGLRTVAQTVTGAKAPKATGSAKIRCKRSQPKGKVPVPMESPPKAVKLASSLASAQVQAQVAGPARGLHLVAKQLLPSGSVRFAETVSPSLMERSQGPTSPVAIQGVVRPP